MSDRARALDTNVTSLRPRRRTAVRSKEGATATVEGSAIVVRDPGGAIVVTYDAATGSATIAAPRGDLTLSAGGSVRVSAGVDLVMESKQQTRLSAEAFTIETGRWELAAARILERAGEAYREVDGLVQTKAGRLRTLVQGAAQLFARTTTLVSEEDTSIDGRRVLLG